MQLESIEAGDQRAWPGMQQPASTAVVASGRPVSQQHETGRQSAPRAARAAPVRDGVAVQPELHQVAHEDDETTPVGDEVVEVGDIGAAAWHALTVRPDRGRNRANRRSVDARGARWKDSSSDERRVGRIGSDERAVRRKPLSAPGVPRLSHRRGGPTRRP
jgi:hypothetical protein